MKIKHIQSTNLWLLSRGEKVLYQGNLNPWRTPAVIAQILLREGKRLAPAAG